MSNEFHIPSPHQVMKAMDQSLSSLSEELAWILQIFKSEMDCGQNAESRSNEDSIRVMDVTKRRLDDWLDRLETAAASVGRLHLLKKLFNYP